MIVCVCANVGEDELAQAICDGCETVADIAMQTGACCGCGICKEYVEDMLPDGRQP